MAKRDPEKNGIVRTDFICSGSVPSTDDFQAEAFIGIGEAHFASKRVALIQIMPVPAHHRPMFIQL
ncbi:MAG TPA: hypothetical protein VKA18_05455, partial [Alphaproteobacteria bacterium]|nr:hypothetical protein [Alphaproteobacteria bacterium]